MKLKTKLLLGVGAYYGVSYYFLKNPLVLHRKKDALRLPPLDAAKGETKYVIAHRGGSAEGPENTL